MKASGLRIAAALFALLAALSSCTCGSPESPPASEGGQGRVLDPLPPAPQLQIDPEALPGAGGELAVVVARPQGDVEGAVRPTVTFSKPVVALQGIESEQGLPPPARITPAVQGEWRWLGSSSVEFVPARQLPYATSYEVVVPAGLRALDGSALANEYRFTFSAPRPVVQRIEEPPGYAWLGTAPRFTLILNQPVEDLAGNTKLVVTSSNAPLQMKLVEEVSVAQEARAAEGQRRFDRMEGDPFENQQTRYVLQPAGPVPLDSDLELVIDGSLRGKQGPLTLGDTQRHAYRSYGPMRVVGLERCLWADGTCPWGPVVLRTSNLLDLASLKTRLTIEPTVEIDWDAAESHLPTRWSGQTVPYTTLPGSWRPGTTYTLRIAAGAADTFGQHAPAFEGSVRLDDREPFYNVGGMVALLESNGDASLPVETVNVPSLGVELWRLDAPQLARSLARRRAPGGAPTITTSLDTSATPNRSKWTPLAVRKLLGDERSTFFAARFSETVKSDRSPELVVGQVTDLAVHAKLGATSGIVWVTRLTTGASVPDASLELYDRDGNRKWQGRTDAEGLAMVPGLSELVPDANESWHWEAPFALVTATKNGESGATLSTWMDGLAPSAFDLPMEWDGTERKSLGLVFAERGIYRPGETVHTKAVARFMRLGEMHKPPAGTEVQINLRDPRGNEVGKQSVRVTKFGTFAADFVVADDAPLGTWVIEAVTTLEKQTISWHGSFRVEEYRAPQFRVDVALQAKDAFSGDLLKGNVSARYLFGGAMADAKASWSVSRSTIEFTPRGNSGFAFGNRTWWWNDGPPHGTTEIAGGGAGSTDASGDLALDLGIVEAPAGRTWRYTVEAEVADVNRQRVAARSTVDVHPASVYAGVRVATTGFAEAGKPTPIEMVAVDLEGTRVEGQALALSVKRREWKSIRKKGVGGHWFTESEPVEEQVHTCAEMSARMPVRCTFTPKEPGLYLMEATVTDAKGRRQTSRDAFYVTGSGWVSWQRNDTDRIDLVADKPVYEAGDTAKILVKSPYPEAEALLTIERSGVISARRVKLTGAATTLEVPVGTTSIPNVFVGVLIVRGRVDEGGIESGEDPGRPAVRVGYTELKVEKTEKKLTVGLVPDEVEKRPGGKVRVHVRVRDFLHNGQPAEVTVWAVDEAVLRLTDYQAPDLLAAMYPRRGLSVRIGEPLLHLVQRQLYGEKGQNPGGGGGADASGAGFRSNFKTTAVFAPTVLTDASGTARVEFDLPDNLTTYRIFGVAVTENDLFGSGEASVTVSKPLLALPALPRAARVGDRFEAGVVLHGRRFSAPQVKVTAFAEGLRIDGPAEQTVAVAEGKPQEVRFRFVAEKPGTAVLRFRAEGGGESDGVEQRIPVKLPVALETVATYGDTKGRTREGLKTPANVRPDVGGLEVTLASTALGGYDENFDQLVDYPYGCLEQEASRLVPFVALRELSGRFGIPWKDAATQWLHDDALAGRDPDAVVRKTVASIQALQNHDGGYRYWSSSPCSSQYASAWAVWALARAKEVGYTVDAQALQRGQAYLADVVAAGRCESCGWGCNPPGDETRVFALWALARTGSPRPSYYGDLFARRADLPLFAQAQLADAMFVGGGDRAQARQLLTEIVNHAQETPGGVHFEEKDARTYAALWSTDTRTTAIVLGTLANISPDHPYVAKIARWLGTARGEDGRYDTTQEAAYALTSLVEVTRVKEADVPAFTARVALGGKELVAQPFEGRSMKIERAALPMSTLGKGGDLDFAVDGTGVLYYGARLRYAPGEMPTQPLDRGLTVQRWFEPYAGGGQSRRFFAGELVRVRVRIASSQQRHYAAIEVPLPAGLEAVDTSLASTAALPRTQQEEGPGEGYEYESADDLYGDEPPEDFSMWAQRFYTPWTHTEIRDDRVLLFADALPPGVHVASFVARATTPGQFVLPPAHAEEMYAPEVFGRSDGGTLEVAESQPVAER